MIDRVEGKERPPAHAGPGPSWVRRAVTWLIWFLCLNALWLVLISAFVLEETLLGILASAVAATAAVAVTQQQPLRFRPRLAWLLPVWRLPFETARQSALILGCLARLIARPGSSTGRFRVVEVSLPDDPTGAATKAALLIAGESFAPNSYVVDLDRERGLMLVHEMVGPEGR
jgi:hypothetical protein